MTPVSCIAVGQRAVCSIWGSARLSTSLCVFVPLEDFNEGCRDAPSCGVGVSLRGALQSRWRVGGATDVLDLRMEALETGGMFMSLSA